MSTRKKTRPPFDAPAAAMRDAGAWLARRDRGFTSAETMEFEIWRHAHPAHAAAVAQLERTMTTFDALREFAPDLASEPDPDAFAPPRASPRWFFPSLAAAGIAAALAFVFWSARPATPSAWHYATAPARYERAALIDGSTIELNGNSVVDVEYSATQRTVRLTRGEAHFQVAKNPARPFVVIANGVSFRAVGTAFKVRLDATEVEMLVTEGQVRVEHAHPLGGSNPAAATHSVSTATTSTLTVASASDESPLLTAGHRIVVSATRAAPPTIAVVTAAEMHQALAWQPSVVEFEKTPLSDVVTAFNRRNRQQLVIADPALESLRLGGNFRVDQPDAFVRLLESSFSIEAERTESIVTLRQAR